VEGDQHLYRPVERLVARGLPADRVADDDRGPVDGDRQLATGVPAESFGLELALLVRVAEPLADVELVLEDDAGTITGEVGRTHVVETPFPALRTNAAAQKERLRGPADVPAPRLGKRKREVRRRRDMDDAVDPLNPSTNGFDPLTPIIYGTGAPSAQTDLNQFIPAGVAGIAANPPVNSPAMDCKVLHPHLFDTPNLVRAFPPGGPAAQRPRAPGV